VSAMLEQIAAELDSAVSADVVETTIAEKIKAGELIPKEVVEQTLSAAIADARKYGRDELQKEISAAQEAAAKQAEATKTRLASVASAGLKPETPLGKDRTIQSVVSAMQAGEEGDKLFADRLEEWIAFKAAAAVPAKKESAASAGTGPAHCLGAQEPVAAPAEPQKVNRSLGLA
jgi:superfamily I DNA and RNA helicase